MRFGAILKASIAAVTLGTAVPATAQDLFDGCPSAPILERFVEFGKIGMMPRDLGKWLNTPAAQYVEPWKPFDNVDFVGICWVSSWMVHTNDGVVLIDTLYGPFTNTLAENIKAAGVDYTDIKYVLMTHGHFDHAGGTKAMKELLPNATFVMTQVGWDEAVASAAASSGARAWEMIEPEVVVADGDTIKIGGNTFKAYETPGHTWGTASYTFDVTDGDNTHRAIVIGGLGLNAIGGPAQVEAFIGSLDRVRTLVESTDENLEVNLATHGFSDNLDEDRQLLAERRAGEPNVFVDPQGLLKQVARLRAGAVTRLEIEKNK